MPQMNQNLTDRRKQGGQVDEIVSPEMLKDLRERYTPHETPHCHICGGEMALHATGPGGFTYYCALPSRKHFSESRAVVHRVGDYRVIALIDAYVKLKG